MKIFITGATGVLGKFVIPLLLSSAHQVYALSRSEKNMAAIRQLGAEPITADLFNSDALTGVLASTQATAIMHLATKIPPTAQMGKVASWQENDHIRRDGARTLVAAALATGVQTFIYPSFYAVYPDRGEQWIDARATPTQSHVIQQATIDAEAEVARFTQANRRGIVLRMGNLYGPEVPSTLEQFQMAQRGLAVLPGSGDAYLPYIWLEDAARALVVALDDTPAGVYDIVDDEPLTRDEFADALAQSVGKRRLLRIPNAIMKLMTGAAANMINRSQRISNRHFKELTTWKPAVPNARQGWTLIAAAKNTHERTASHV
ncbi:nucleoside-diphosphate sugar epimerase [Dictyobacter alpinus]|uniref:Nucleoside-diphosphate sugar epimerase n=1 Tax=Dictyobacter alpinus TaxID=2014873 RepID=A0A402BGB0_9CHLR|nr:NAD-dependent epimerase/dehydratase family protein [Dictyobacter alpinus]GCE30434.1 nucleoside-diphosphate sugar epimerase [Dictyobacter alpinus]